MNDHGLGRWGQFLEAELIGLQLVTMHALTSGTIDMPSQWVRGRSAAPTLLLNADDVKTVVDATWLPDVVFAWREVPSIQFVTEHGSVIVTDLWGDTQYRSLCGVKARSALTLGAPLIRAATLVEQLCHKGSTSPVLVTLVGNERVDPLRQRVPLRAWSSYANPHEVKGEECAWLADENHYNRAGARAVLRNYLAANASIDTRGARQRR